MEKYRLLGKKGEGTFSEVLKCQNIKDGSYWACKKMKQQYTTTDQIKEIREIQALRQLSNNPYILQLHEVIFEKKNGILCLIFELMDMNIYELIRSQRNYISHEKVCKYMYQLLQAVDYMHRHGYFHRDIKPENILIKDDSLKLADFGSCRRIHSKHPFTEYISTRWYRAPECLLTDGYYSFHMDLWSVGCVMFEIITLHPLFPGANEIDQIDKIHEIMGTPEQNVLEKFKNKSRTMRFDFKHKRGIGINRFMQHSSAESIHLINLLCTYDPEQRISAHKALKHEYFETIRSDNNDIYIKDVPSKNIKHSSQENLSKIIDNRYDEDIGSKLEVISIPVSEPYKPVVKRKKKQKLKDLINNRNTYPVPPQTNSSSNSALSHYSAATSIGLTKRYVDSRHSTNSYLLPKLSSSTNSLQYTSFPSMNIQKAFSNINENTLPSIIQTSNSPNKFFSSNNKLNTSNNNKVLYKNYFPTLSNSDKKKTNYL